MAKELARRTSEQNPFREMMGLRDTINSLFEDFVHGRPFLGGPLFGAGAPEGWTPPVDIVETDSELIVYACVPGCAKADCSVEVQDSTLVLTGKRTEPVVSGDACALRQEMPRGEFYRAFSLPTEVKADQVKATFRDGIIEIRLPKSEEARPHRVQIA